MRAFLVAMFAICMVSIASAQPKKPPKGGGKPPPPPAPVVSANKQRADALFEDGRRYLEKKEYALACTAFEQSNEAEPAIGTLLNIALCYEIWGKTASAYRWYLESERTAREKKDDREKGARQKVDELAPKVPHLQVNIPPTAEKSVVYLLDGKETTREKLADDLLLDPGAHDIEVRVPGREPKKTTVDLMNGERKRVNLEMPRAPVKEIVTPRNKRRLYGGIGLMAGGALTMGTAGFVALIARQDYVNAIENCPMQTCEQRDDYDKTQDARTRATYMTFVTIGGAAIVGAGLYLVLTSKGKPITVEKAAFEITPLVGPDQMGLAVGGGW